MSSHEDPNVNTKFLVWLNEKYGEHGEVKATHGRKHDYLGMIFTFKENGEVDIEMIDYVKRMLEDFSIKFKNGDRTANPANTELFNGDISKNLENDQKELFHTFTAKALFLGKRARIDI